MSPGTVGRGPARVDAVLAEYEQAEIDHRDPQLATLQRAIFIEDVLDVTLSDDELKAGRLGDADDVRRVIGLRSGRD